MATNKHENYEILNLIGYGLAKFDKSFINEFGFETKIAFYENIISLGIAETVGTVKNRQDLFDNFFDNGRKGWWQKGDAYIHRKNLIDSLFGNLDAVQYAETIKIYIQSKFTKTENETEVSPVSQSRFRQLQLTGREAELYFMHNFRVVKEFKDGILEDARFFGDGYDFQIQIANQYLLAEVKGVRNTNGSIRLTEKEFSKANEYKDRFGLVVVSNLESAPKLTVLFNPLQTLPLEKRVIETRQISYHSEFISW